MRTQALGGLAMALVAIAVGLAWLGGALRLRRRRAEFAPTYAATGGAFYTAVQIGCAGVLIMLGLIILTLALLAR